MSSNVLLTCHELVGGKRLAAKPHFVAATLVGVTAVECRLPLEVGRATAGVDASGALTKRPFLARWQVKVRTDLVDIVVVVVDVWEFFVLKKYIYSSGSITSFIKID